MDIKHDKYFLPTEIWLKVIEEATFGANEGIISHWTGDYDRLEMGRYHRYDPYITDDLAIAEQRAWLEYETRQSLTLVSKAWHALSIPTLYRSILVANGVQIQQLIGTLRSNPERRSFVKIFVTTVEPPTLRYRENEDDPTPETREKLSVRYNIREIYQTCPNLVFVDDRNDCGKLLQLHLNGQDHPKKLQIFDGRRFFMVRRYPILSFVDNLWTFQSLRLLTLTVESQYLRVEPPEIYLPNLEILSLMIGFGYGALMDQFLSKAEFPKLHSLHLCIWERDHLEDYAHPLHIFRHTCEKWGSQLLTLNVEDRRKVDDQASARRMLETLSQIKLSMDDTFPNLQQLIVNDTMIPLIFHPMARSASIRLLEVRNHDGLNMDMLNANMTAYDGTIVSEELGKNLRNLQKIRFSAPFNLSGQGDMGMKHFTMLHAFLSQHRTAIEARGITIEVNITIRTLDQDDEDDEADDL